MKTAFVLAEDEAGGVHSVLDRTASAGSWRESAVFLGI